MPANARPIVNAADTSDSANSSPHDDQHPEGNPTVTSAFRRTPNSAINANVRSATTASSRCRPTITSTSRASVSTAGDPTAPTTESRNSSNM
ncbi:hypothetical protein [Speluncibacter jeojiensis]|uniref:hypothetical protein n=1 Tax=Speluncibacter jeojiensis TaxID=2710754 RepID=UPI00241072BD|nr:hypothetical protein [Rhodococcus sp. D2-41]